MANKDLVSLQFPGLNDTYIIPKETAWMTYGTSTNADIEAAYQANKLVAVIATVGGYPYVLILAARYSSTDHLFTANEGSGFIYAECDNGTWTSGATSLPKPQSSGTPSALGAAARGTSNFFSRSDHVHPMPSVSDVGAVAVAQGVGHAGEFVVVGSDGNITTVTMTAWSGGSY